MTAGQAVGFVARRYAGRVKVVRVEVPQDSADFKRETFEGENKIGGYPTFVVYNKGELVSVVGMSRDALMKAFEPLARGSGERALAAIEETFGAPIKAAFAEKNIEGALQEDGSLIFPFKGRDFTVSYGRDVLFEVFHGDQTASSRLVKALLTAVHELNWPRVVLIGQARLVKLACIVPWHAFSQELATEVIDEFGTLLDLE